MFGRLGTLLMGGAIGAGIAMLMAPKTGRETQVQLRERMRGLKEQYGPMIEQGRIRATELVQSGREVIEETQTRVSSAMERTRTGEDTAQTSSEHSEGQPPHQPL